MKKNLLFLLLVLGVTFSSCKKDDPVVVTDARDKFVGTWSGTTNLYEAGVLVGSGPSNYSISKDANNSNKILITDAANGIINCPASVNGNSYSILNFTTSYVNSSYVVNGTGTINGNSIIENGSQVETDLTTGDVFNYTYTTSLSK
jgi:hypothetical protein